MRCPNCGNEVGPQEAFCGQCGTPNMPPARPTEMVNTPSLQSGLLSGNLPSSSYPYNAAPSSPSAGSLPPNQQPAWPTSPQQQSEFYQQPTEAVSTPLLNNSQVYPAGYVQPGMGTGQYNPQMQPFQTGGYTGTGYQQPPAPTFPGGQGYGYPGGVPSFTPPPPKQRHNGILVFASVCLVVALLVVVAFGAIYLSRGHSTSNTQITPTATAAPTSAPSPTATPNPSPTPTDTPTPSPSPTPTTAPTPTPDPGFTFCTQCVSNGFQVEYPQNWSQQTTSDSTGVMYTNPSASDQYAAFKTPGVTSQNASGLVSSDLQNNFASKPGYMPPASLSTTTIGGETWAYGVAYYASSPTAQEQVEVFATVHQGNAYIIELQASKNDFVNVNTQYFEKMLGSFQFVQQSTSQ